MRVAAAMLVVVLATLLGATTALGRGAAPPGSAAERSLSRSLAMGMREAGSYSGAYVVDLDTGKTLYARNAAVGRLPASVEKLYTTTAALTRWGPDARFSTSVLGRGHQRGATFTGTLYLRGSGDPSFGSAGFDRTSYGSGATIQRLVSNLIDATQIRTLKGNVVADETLFDSVRGTPATGDQPSLDVEGELSALSYNRGWTDSTGQSYYSYPALEAGVQLVAALKAAGVEVQGAARVSAGRTAAGAVRLAGVLSPRIATLISLINTPSDNFFAEMLLKGLGARFGRGGTTADGAAVVESLLAGRFGIHPRLNDGSGLSRYDRSTPIQVVTLLRDMAADPWFTGSLAVAGRTGTLRHEMRGTPAQGRCRGKTGTLHDVSNVAGYCRAADGHTLAYAFLMNGIYPYYAHPIQDRMQVALAGFNG